MTEVLFMIMNDVFGIPIKCPWYYDEEIQWDEPHESDHEEVQQEVASEQVQELPSEKEHQNEQVGDSEQVQQGSRQQESQPIPISVIHPEQCQPSLALSTITGKGQVEAIAESSRSIVAPDLQEYIQQQVQAQIQAHNVTSSRNV